MSPRFLVVVALLAVPVTTLAGEFDAFRVPEHTWRGGTASLSGQYRHDNGSENSPAPGSSRSSYGAGALDLGFDRGYDSDRFQRAWSVRTFGGSSDQSQQATAGPAPAISRDYWARTTSGAFIVSGAFRAYPKGRDLGLEVSGAFVAASGEAVFRSDFYEPSYFDPAQHLEIRQNQQSNEYQYAGQAAIALGHGIVRDATVVEDVHVLEERLLLCGTLSRALSPGARERLAALLVATPFIAYAHDRPARFEWREIERVLRDDGALAGGSLDAYGLQRALEPYLSVPSRRRIGHFAGLAATLEHRHQIARRASDATLRYYDAGGLVNEARYSDATQDAGYGDRAWLGAAAEWHRPAGWNVQWDARGSALLAARAGEHGLQEFAELGAEWHVADRWQVGGRARQERKYLDPGSREDSMHEDGWRTYLAGSLQYFVEDHLSLALTVSDQQGNQRTPGAYGTYGIDAFQHSLNVQLGMTWRFLGRATAPGLFDPMTVLR